MLSLWAQQSLFFSLGSTHDFIFQLMCSLRNSMSRFERLGPCYPYGRPGLIFQLLVRPDPSPPILSIQGVNQQMEILLGCLTNQFKKKKKKKLERKLGWRRTHTCKRIFQFLIRTQPRQHLILASKYSHLKNFKLLKLGAGPDAKITDLPAFSRED